MSIFVKVMMEIVGFFLIILVLTIVMSCCYVSGMCSRYEEKLEEERREREKRLEDKKDA